jgi:hypothetical protein
LFPITHFAKLGWKIPEVPEKKPTQADETAKPHTQLCPVHTPTFDCAKSKVKKEREGATKGDADVSDNEGQSSRPDPPSPNSKLPNTDQREKPLKQTEHGKIPRM